MIVNNLRFAKFVSVRVQTGDNKSRKLISNVSSSTRPTSSRVRKSIFDILWSREGVEGKTVLDLFAGTGSLGIEALSRGADVVIFVDHSRIATNVISENLSRLSVSPERSKVYTMDYLGFVKGFQGPMIDIALLDPPYAFQSWRGLLESVPARVILCESDRSIDGFGGVEKILERKYGSTLITLFRKSQVTESEKGSVS